MLSEGEAQRITDERQTVGRLLRKAREGQDLSFEQVSQTTKVHVHHIVALERGDYEAFPDPGWARGCMLLYAGHLGLEGEELADRAIPLQALPLSERYLKRHWRAILAVLAIAGIAIVMGVVAIIAPYNPVSRTVSDALQKVAPGVFLGSEPQRIAVLSVSDSGAYQGGGIMVVRVAEDGLGVLSIPSDTQAEIPGYGRGEIGEAVNMGGPDLVRKTAARLTGSEVQYYSLIRPAGIRKIVGSADGVRIDVPSATSGKAAAGGPIINLSPGPQNLNADEALVYLQGNDLPTDAERARRQQDFLYAMFRQALGPSNLLTNPTALRTGTTNVETNLSSVQMVQLAGRIRELKESGTAPETDTLSDRAEATSTP